MLPPLQPILPETLFHPKEIKSKEKDKKKDKKEKKKKKDKEKERDKERERERPSEKEEKKKEKEKEKKEKIKEKEKPKAEKSSLMVEAPVVPQSPVIPRLKLKVGAGQDKIVISKVTPDLEPTPPPPRTPVPRSGPGSRIRSLPAPLPPVPPPVAPVHIPPPVLVPPPPPPAPVFQPPVGQAKARGCSVVTETVSAYVVRDEWGNKIWICPGCNKPDDGSPMIGCDECDDWYHWPCVGLQAAPPEDQSWFCVKCSGKKKDKKTKKRKRKAH